MKHSIIALSLMLLCGVSFDSSASELENYQVDQEQLETVTAPISGLLKANCKFYNQEGEQLAHQNVTVIEQWDNITIIELSASYEIHNKIVTVKCL